jgi:hypothetical protein
VRAAACLGLEPAPPQSASAVWSTVVDSALDQEKALSQRACAVLVARRLELADAGNERIATLLRDKLRLAHIVLNPGLARALLAAEPSGSLFLSPALLTVLRFEANQPGAAEVSPSTNDVAGWLSSRESVMASAHRARRGDIIRGVTLTELVRARTNTVAQAALEAPVEFVELVLADLANHDSVITALSADPGQDLPAARIALLSHVMPALRRLVEDPIASRRGPALMLLSELPPGAPIIANVLLHASGPDDRMAALRALAASDPAAVATMATELEPALTRSLRAEDWRERREALRLWQLQPGLIPGSPAQALAHDPNPLVRLH